MKDFLIIFILESIVNIGEIFLFYLLLNHKFQLKKADVSSRLKLFSFLLLQVLILSTFNCTSTSMIVILAFLLGTDILLALLFFECSLMQSILWSGIYAIIGLFADYACILLPCAIAGVDANASLFGGSLHVPITFLHLIILAVIILILIQNGGMGFMTIGVCVAILLRRKIGLKVRGILQESINSIQIGGIVKLTKKIIKGTLFFESIGAVLLMIRFIPEFGIGRGIWYGIFHSISAFCNAGFDLMGENGAYQSLIRYSDDWLVNTVIMLLIIIGGIGFLVWDDLSVKKFQWKKYHLHTKIVLSTTGFLIIGGAVLFLILEKNNVLAGMPVKEQILCSLFHSVTARTAGFNTTDTGALTEGSKLVTMILMFIGGSPGSTAGGIKTTTVVVLIVFVRANLMEAAGCNVFNRRLDETAIRKACVVMCTNLFLILTGFFAAGFFGGCDV